MHRRLSGLFIVILLILMLWPAQVTWAATPVPETPIPVPTPAEGTDEERDAATTAAAAATRVVRYTLDPSQVLKDLIEELLGTIFRDFVRFGAHTADETWTSFRAQTRPDKNWQKATYERVGSGLRVIAAAFFIAFAVLRLVWYHKSQLAGESDSVFAVVAEWISIGLLTAFFPRLLDWTWDFSLRMANAILGTIELSNNGMTPGSMLLQALHPGGGLAEPFFLFIVAILLLGVMYGVVAAYFAIQAAAFVFATLTPILLAFSLLPPFRFVRRFLAMAYLLLLVTPSIAALAMVAVAWLPSGNAVAGDPSTLGVFTRIVWLGTLMGLLLKSATMLGSVGLDVARGLVSATVKAATTAAVTLGAGALLGGAVAVGASGAAAGAGAGAAAGAGSGAGAAASAGGAATAASRFHTAANLADMAGLVAGRGRLGFAARALGRYYRSLAQTRHTSPPAATGIEAGSDGAAASPAHSSGFLTARSLGMAGGYQSYVSTLHKVNDLLQGQREEDGTPVQPLVWSQYNDDQAPLAGALVAVYREDPQKFQAVLKKQGWSGVRELASQRLQGGTS